MHEDSLCLKCSNKKCFEWQQQCAIHKNDKTIKCKDFKPMKGPCKSCGHILHLEHGECHHCRDKHASGDIWLAAAIVLVVIGVLLAWFGVDWLFESTVKLTMAGW